jgi:hypothetical protein
MKRRNNRNSKKAKNAPRLQLSKQINLFTKSDSAYVNISYPVFIYGYSVSGLYSFSGISDSRSIGFTSITGSTEFSNFSNVYKNFRIRSCSIIVAPTSQGSVAPILYCGLDPESTTGNPTNSDFIMRDKVHMFTNVANTCKSCTFKVPGVGTTTNIWLPVSATPAGQFVIGNNTYTGIFSSTSVIFDCQLSFLVEFNNPV